MIRRPTPGYYPGFSTLAQQHFWDAATRDIVLARVETVPPIRFFDAGEVATLEAVCATVLPQDDRDDERRIPIVPRIDERLYENRHDGYRYENMLPDREAYRRGLRAIDEMAREHYDREFARLESRERETLLVSIHHGKPDPTNVVWHEMAPEHFWMMVLGDCAEAYYAHPWAWDEIGFGGPAYPRAYMRLERGEPEPWEVRERRHEFMVPPETISDAFEPVGGNPEQRGVPGQGGTH